MLSGPHTRAQGAVYGIRTMGTGTTRIIRSCLQRPQQHRLHGPNEKQPSHHRTARGREDGAGAASVRVGGGGKDQEDKDGDGRVREAKVREDRAEAARVRVVGGTKTTARTSGMRNKAN